MGTHINQTNGYSKVVYNLCNQLLNFSEQKQNTKIDLTLWGFQNLEVLTKENIKKMNENDTSIKDKDTMQIPQEIKIRKLENLQCVDGAQKDVDYLQDFENNKKKGTQSKYQPTQEEIKQGFGFSYMEEYFSENIFDIIVIFNDLIVVTKTLQLFESAKQNAKNEKIKNTKKIVYLDYVYFNYYNPFLQNIHQYVDGYMCFSDQWKECLLGQFKNHNLDRKQVDVLNHGFDNINIYQFPSDIAREFLQLNEEDFIILNMNRNTTRKRLDGTIIGYVSFLKILQQKGKKTTNIKLFLGNTREGIFDIDLVFNEEVKRQSVNIDSNCRYIYNIAPGQLMSDWDVNVIYNATDVGLNTASGEGFGLCCFEQGALGKPQIMTNTQSIRDIFNEKNGIILNSQSTLYSFDKQDSIQNSLMCIPNYEIIGEHLYKLYSDKHYRKQLGAQSRKHITENFTWDKIGNDFRKILLSYQQKIDNNIIIDNSQKQEIDLENLSKEELMTLLKEQMKINKKQES